MTYLAITDHQTTINFNSDGILLERYVPTWSNEGNITETIEIAITGSTVSEIVDKIRAIEKAITTSQHYQDNRLGKQWYIQITPNDMTTVLESPIYSGRVVLSDNALRWPLRNKRVRAGVVIERANWWEKTTEEEIPLTNGNGSGVTGGINVFNCNDGSGTTPNKRNNYVEMSNLGGELPARCRIEIVNWYNSSSRLYNIWIGKNAFSNPSSFTHVIEGESASYGGTNMSGSFSGGYTRLFTWSGDAKAYIAQWSLAPSMLEAGGGRWFKVYAALTNTLDNIYMQLKLTFPSGVPLTILQQDQEKLVNTNYKFSELGTLQLPPWLEDITGLYPIDLTLFARKTGGGSFGIDFLYFMPAEGFLLLSPKGYGLAYLTRVVYDGMNEVVYSDWWSPSGKASHYMRYGADLLLEPGITNRLYFQQSCNTGDINIDRLIRVRVYYKARYGTI